MAREHQRSTFGNWQAGTDGPSVRSGSSPTGTGAGDTPIVVRQIEDGVPLNEEENAAFDDIGRYVQEADNRMALAIIPTPEHSEIEDVATAWNLHPLLAEDLMHAGQRPKLERYGDVLFMVVRSARYIDEIEEVEFSEFHLIMQPRALTVICQDGRLIDGTQIGTPEAQRQGASDAPLGAGAPLLDNEKLLKLGPEAMAYRLLDGVVDGYFPVLDGLQNDKDEIERQVFSGDPTAAERIYNLSQEVVDLLHAATALAKVIERLRTDSGTYGGPAELQAYLADVADHLVRVVTEATALRDALSQILSVNATLVSQRQNEDMKKISGWAAILVVPTIISAIYGMNFDKMPELHWAFGYPMAIGAMVVSAAALYYVFKRKDWM